MPDGHHHHQQQQQQQQRQQGQQGQQQSSSAHYLAAAAAAAAAAQAAADEGQGAPQQNTTTGVDHAGLAALPSAADFATGSTSKRSDGTIVRLRMLALQRSLALTMSVHDAQPGIQLPSLADATRGANLGDLSALLNGSGIGSLNPYALPGDPSASSSSSSMHFGPPGSNAAKLQDFQQAQGNGSASHLINMLTPVARNLAQLSGTSLDFCFQEVVKFYYEQERRHSGGSRHDKNGAEEGAMSDVLQQMCAPNTQLQLELMARVLAKGHGRSNGGQQPGQSNFYSSPLPRGQQQQQQQSQGYYNVPQQQQQYPQAPASTRDVMEDEEEDDDRKHQHLNAQAEPSSGPSRATKPKNETLNASGKPKQTRASGGGRGHRKGKEAVAFRPTRKEKSEDGPTRPPYQYCALIGQAILSRPDHKARLSDIYEYILENYSYYKRNESGWQNSVRHNLSLQSAFQRVPDENGKTGKGSLWTIEPSEVWRFDGGGWKKGSSSATKKPRASTSSNQEIEASSHPLDSLGVSQGPSSHPSVPLDLNSAVAYSLGTSGAPAHTGGVEMPDSFGSLSASHASLPPPHHASAYEQYLATFGAPPGVTPGSVPSFSQSQLATPQQDQATPTIESIVRAAHLNRQGNGLYDPTDNGNSIDV